MSRYFRAKVKENLPLNVNHNILSLVNLDDMNEPLPGQFYMIGVNRGKDPLLKRAFSLFRRVPDGFQILYRIKGKGTAIMRNIKEGTVIDVLGPLGNSYPDPSAGHVPVVVTGGVGIASVFPLVGKFSGNAYVFYGARKKDELFMLDELKSLSKELIITTDDGSAGRKGNVVEALDDFFAKSLEQRAKCLIYSCGPVPMLREISKIAVASGVKAYVSLEENMACGVGACLGCAVKTKKGYERVCKEGPVFPIEEIVW